MSEHWYYRSFGQDFGPVPFDQLKELAASESIGATDEIRRDDATDWVLASSIPELGFVVAESGTVIVAAPIASNDWYCLFYGQEMGPIGFDEIAAFAEQGQLSEDDQVKLGAEGKWRRVGSIGRLVAVIPYKAAQQTIPEKRSEPVIAIIPQAVAPVPAPVPAHTPAVVYKQPVAQTAPIAAPAEPVKPADPPTARLSSPVMAVRTEAPVEPATSPTSSAADRRSYPGGLSSTPSPYRPTVPPRPIARSSKSSSDFSIISFLMGPGAIAGGIIVVIGLIYVGWNYLPQGNGADIERYTSLKKFLDDVRSARTSNSLDASTFKRRAQQFSADYIPALKHANGSMPAKQNLLWAVRDELPKMMAKDLKTETVEEKRFASRLASAATSLGVK